MAKTTEQKPSLPSRGGSYVREGEKLKRVAHTKPADEVPSRRKAKEATTPAPAPKTTPNKE
ncbi:MAG: hypothetical protein K0R58_239 [Ramlibacter sp.]|jgi:hypothetical protein|nr:hypothetical protein [Ramlibacter sp.]